VLARAAAYSDGWRRGAADVGRGAGLRLSGDEARRRFAYAPVARLATVGPDGGPHLVPITFAVEGDHIYTAVDAKPKSSRQLRRLRNIAANPRVTLLADHYEQDWERLWWVRVDGHASVLAGAGEMAAPLRLLAVRYPQYRDSPPDGPVIHIHAAHWTGWAAAQADS
jgi:PPOX class probable F420-dependent enzyme